MKMIRLSSCITVLSPSNMLFSAILTITTLALHVGLMAFMVQAAVHRWSCHRIIHNTVSLVTHCLLAPFIQLPGIYPSLPHSKATNHQYDYVHNRVIVGERSQQGNAEPRHHTRHTYSKSQSHCSMVMTSLYDVTLFFEQEITRQRLIREAEDCIPFISFPFPHRENTLITA